MKLFLIGLMMSAQAYSPFIVGGNIADKSDASYMVSLQDELGHFCGGSLISSNVVLTAAHCANYARLVVLGTNNLNKPKEKIKVKKIKVHEKYNKRTSENDVALLFLDRNSVEQSIKLCDKNPINGELSTVYGWGALKENGPSPSLLQKVDVPIVSQSICNAPDSYNGKIMQSMLCAGVPEGGKDSCQGDSGGPLVIEGKVCGVVSWGYGCARPNLYGVYSDVFYLRDWITENVKAN